MSTANLILAKRFFEDRSQLELARFLSFLHSDAEIDFSELEGPYGCVYRGREQIERLFHEMTHGCREIRLRATKPICGDDRVVLDVERTVLTGPARLGVTSDVTACITVRQGRIIRFKIFNDRANALTAAGLAE